jgi:hypothetical protein
MAFRYACFISYRAGDRQSESPYTVTLIKGLRDHLSYELQLLLDEDVSQVFVDWHRLQGGDFFNAKLARALCQSVCMLAIYTPTYFSLKHPYCAREYRAMEQLERQRFRAIKRNGDAESGLIIPLVLRNKKGLPTAIRDKRHFYDFEDFLQGDNQITKPAGYFTAIKEIASYIAERYWELSAEPRTSGDCSAFDFPSEAQVRPWLRNLTGRSGGTQVGGSRSTTPGQRRGLTPAKQV